ncbi:hypothetical protein EUAN_03040 [Andreesenia angusta]|uniref:Uncharacterized protein n=1 Tax=Andreesenia angusta TaxID=39480 RepID=A0A1S1VAH7_9FIRM|nr:hypothetical protein [Andreesenia angusta]OHW63440.1 hypothetical protein EUAN_03040 [Andreesenia angusta]
MSCGDGCGKKGLIYPEEAVKSGIGFGSALAIVVSYTANGSIGWAIIHGLLGWIYVVYYWIKYAESFF